MEWKWIIRMMMKKKREDHFRPLPFMNKWMNEGCIWTTKENHKKWMVFKLKWILPFFYHHSFFFIIIFALHRRKKNPKKKINSVTVNWVWDCYCHQASAERKTTPIYVFIRNCKESSEKYTENILELDYWALAKKKMSTLCLLKFYKHWTLRIIFKRPSSICDFFFRCFFHVFFRDIIIIISSSPLLRIELFSFAFCSRHRMKRRFLLFFFLSSMILFSFFFFLWK